MAVEKKASAEHWTALERAYYKQNRNAVDRETLFKLAKEISSLSDTGYASVGYMVSDKLLSTVRESLNGGKLYFPRPGNKQI